jgi:hypothetical protein
MMLRATEAMRSPHQRTAICGSTLIEIRVAQAMIGMDVVAIRMLVRDCRRAIAHLLGSMPLTVLLKQPKLGRLRNLGKKRLVWKRDVDYNGTYVRITQALRGL